MAINIYEATYTVFPKRLIRLVYGKVFHFKQLECNFEMYSHWLVRKRSWPAHLRTVSEIIRAQFVTNFVPDTVVSCSNFA